MTFRPILSFPAKAASLEPCRSVGLASFRSANHKKPSVGASPEWMAACNNLGLGHERPKSGRIAATRNGHLSKPTAFSYTFKFSYRNRRALFDIARVDFGIWKLPSKRYGRARKSPETVNLVNLRIRATRRNPPSGAMPLIAKVAAPAAPPRHGPRRALRRAVPVGGVPRNRRVAGRRGWRGRRGRRRLPRTGGRRGRRG